MTSTIGKFISFEGIEGSGKSTQSKLLFERLQKESGDVVFSIEPGGTEPGKQIRTVLLESGGELSPKTELLLFYAARVENIRQIISPALLQGKTVICDRFADSSMAYQAYGHGLGRPVVEAVHNIFAGVFEPDLTFLMDIDVDFGLKRVQESRGGMDRIERMEVQFHKRVRDGFLDIARREPSRFYVVDATKPVTEIAEEVYQTYKAHLRK